MKLTILYLASLFFLLKYISSVKIKNTQLFDAIQKSVELPNSPSTNSLFGNPQLLKSNVLSLFKNFFKIIINLKTNICFHFY